MTKEDREESVRILKMLIPKDSRGNGKVKTNIAITEAILNAVEALEQESCKDCISRKRAIERLMLNLPTSQGADNSRDRHRYMQALADLQAIKELPSVTPQKSEWEHDHEVLKGYSDGANEALDKIRAEIEKAVWEDSIYSRDGADEVRIPRLDPDDVFEIIDKYKEEDFEELDFVQPHKIVGKLISVDVLDKIRAEIEQLHLIGYATVDGKREIASRAVIQILDKYTAESEEV